MPVGARQGPSILKIYKLYINARWGPPRSREAGKHLKCIEMHVGTSNGPAMLGKIYVRSRCRFCDTFFFATLFFFFGCSWFCASHREVNLSCVPKCPRPSATPKSFDFPMDFKVSSLPTKNHVFSLRFSFCLPFPREAHLSPRRLHSKMLAAPRHP